MKKLTFKIRKGTKQMILGLSILGVLGLSAYYSRTADKAMPAMAFIGIVATLKTKGKWESLPQETKDLLTAQDEGTKDLLTFGDLDVKLKDFAAKADLGEQITKEQALELKEMISGYKEVALKLKKIEDAGLASGGSGNLIMKTLEENRDSIHAFRKRKTRELSLEVKSGATQDVADVETHTIGYRVPGVGQKPVRKPLVLDVFTTVPVNLEYIKYMDQETVVRDAKNVAGIASSTHTTKLTWKERTIQITKVRDFVYVNLDMLEDYDFVKGEVERLINTSVVNKADNGLLLDDGTYPNLHSIDEVSSEFSASNTLSGTIEPWAGTVERADFYALIVAMASQIIALGLENNYMPDTVLINTIDKYKALLIKDAHGQYVLPPFVARVNGVEMDIEGMKVKSNPNVPANSCYVFDSTKGVIYMRKGIGIEIAYNNNDDFEKEMATMKAYMRLNLLIRNVDANAFMKCSDMAAAITSLEKGASS